MKKKFMLCYVLKKRDYKTKLKPEINEKVSQILGPKKCLILTKTVKIEISYKEEERGREIKLIPKDQSCSLLQMHSLLKVSAEASSPCIRIFLNINRLWDPPPSK